MKLFNKIKSKYQLVSSLKYIRFSTLTRPMIAVKSLETRIASHKTNIGDDFLLRVQQCYKRATKDYQSNTKSMWHDLEDKNADFIAALLSDRPAKLRNYAENLYSGNLLMGMGHVQGFIHGKKTIYPKKYFSLRIIDATLLLAEALGVNSLPSNQQTSWDNYIGYLNQDLSEIISEVENILGYQISTKEIGCPPVAEIGDRLFNPDFIRHAYIMHRIEQIGIDKDANILEIGGGYGCVAYFANLKGYKNYHIIDLPYVNAIQMLFLGAALGPDNVSGYGEKKSSIQLIPSNEKMNISKKSFDLALNMDSLPEIAAEEAIQYMQLIERTSKCLISINQEAQKIYKNMGEQNLVRNLVRVNAPSLKLSSRQKYWMEQGYAEEIYQNTSSK